MTTHTGDPGAIAAQLDRRPRSIQIATQLMVVGAVLSFVSTLVSWLVGLPDYRAELRVNRDYVDLSPSATLWLTFVPTIGIAAIGVLLWLWMARKNGQGRPWARVVATTFFVLSTLHIVSLVWTPRTEPVAEIAVGLAIWLVGLGAVIFMWQRESTVYYHSTAAWRATR